MFYRPKQRCSINIFGQWMGGNTKKLRRVDLERNPGSSTIVLRFVGEGRLSKVVTVEIDTSTATMLSRDLELAALDGHNEFWSSWDRDSKDDERFFYASASSLFSDERLQLESRVTRVLQRLSSEVSDYEELAKVLREELKVLADLPSPERFLRDLMDDDDEGRATHRAFELQERIESEASSIGTLRKLMKDELKAIDAEIESAD